MRLAVTRTPEGQVELRVVLDDATAAWLAAMADDCRTSPEHIAGVLLRDIREDDEDAHFEPPPLRVVGGTETTLN